MIKLLKAKAEHCLIDIVEPVIGIEQDEKYYDMAEMRIRPYANSI